MIINPYFAFRNQRKSGGVGFVFGDTYGLGFLQVSEDALGLSYFIVGAVEAVTLEGHFEDGPLNSG